MNTWIDWAPPVGYGALGLALAAAAGLVLWRAIRSPLAPLPIPLMAWRQAWAFPIGHPLVAAAMAAISFVGTAAQFYFMNTQGHDGATLTYVSIGWQALVAASMAALAVPLAQTIIAMEPYRAFVPARLKPVARSRIRLVIFAAVTGLAVWLIVYALTIALRIALHATPTDWQTVGSYLLTLFGFLTGSLLAFVWPALVSGYRNPVATGLATAWRNSAPLYLVAAAMALVPVAFELITFGILFVFGGGLAVKLILIFARTVFYLYQFLALEAAMVILFRCCVLEPVKGFTDVETDAPAAYARFRPY